MNELIAKPEYMHEVAGEWYMDGRHVAEILGKEFKKTIRDLKTIVLMERDGEMVHHRDHSDLIDIFSVKGVICTKDDRGYVKDALINEHYCRLLQMYGDFRAVIRLNAEWEAMREWIEQQKNTPARQLPPPATLRDKMDCANLVLNALPNLSERSKQALLAPLAQEAGLYLEFPVVEQQFMSTSDLANLVGCSPQKLGRWANAHSLKVPQYGEIRLSKARHCDKQIEQWYWNEKGVKVVCEMFAED